MKQLISKAYKDGLKDQDELTVYLSLDEVATLVKQACDIEDHYVGNVRMNMKMVEIKLNKEKRV